VKGWNIIFQTNRIQKQARVAILISNKTDFKTKISQGAGSMAYLLSKCKALSLIPATAKKLVERNKEGDDILIKGIICQEEITIKNIYALNIGVPNFIK
jgi:hypothetical protein